MIIKCIDIDIPRVDGKGKVGDITLGKEYEVLASNKLGLESKYFYRIVNDSGKESNYMRIRFEQVSKNVVEKSVMVESLLNLRRELSKYEDTHIRMIVFKINSCLYSKYPTN